MTHQLKSRDIIALGFMTFALFVGAGNIIFPPMVGLQAGEHVWTAAIGFLITAVGLPVLTVVALAKVGGGVDSLSTPIGKVAGLLLGDRLLSGRSGRYFATPRTATVSFEVGIAPLTGDFCNAVADLQRGLFRYRYSGFPSIRVSCWIR